MTFDVTHTAVLAMDCQTGIVSNSKRSSYSGSPQVVWCSRLCWTLAMPITNPS